MNPVFFERFFDEYVSGIEFLFECVVSVFKRRKSDQKEAFTDGVGSELANMMGSLAGKFERVWFFPSF